MLDILLIIFGITFIATAFSLQNNEKTLEKLRNKRKPNETDEAYIVRIKRNYIVYGIITIVFACILIILEYVIK